MMVAWPLSLDSGRTLGEDWGCYSMNETRWSMVSNSLLKPTAVDRAFGCCYWLLVKKKETEGLRT